MKLTLGNDIANGNCTEKRLH